MSEVEEMTGTISRIRQKLTAYIEKRNREVIKVKTELGELENFVQENFGEKPATQ